MDITHGPHGQPAHFDVERSAFVCRDEQDGIMYEYDAQKKAWFPLFDEGFVTKQQSVYGAVVETDAKDELLAKREEIAQKRKEPKPKAPKANTSVYVSGLPDDAAIPEIAEYFQKCGVLMLDVVSGDARIKMYPNADGEFKGDALITYFKPESVQLAVNMLDESRFRPDEDSLIRVQLPEFKGPPASTNAGDSDVQRKRKADPLITRKRFKELESKLDWEEEVETVSKKAERLKRTVVLRHMFVPGEFDSAPELLLDLKQDIRDECLKFGNSPIVAIFDSTEDGACTVRFREELSALACVKVMNGRYFAGRRVRAHISTGEEKFSKSKGQDQDDDEKRLEEYSKWIEGHRE